MARKITGSSERSGGHSLKITDAQWKVAGDLAAMIGIGTTSAVLIGAVNLGLQALMEKYVRDHEPPKATARRAG